MEETDSPWAGIDPRGLHRVKDPAQARIVADPLRSRFLHPFLGRELSVSQAAAEIGCAPNAMLYRVRRMLDADLLRITETRQRAGRPIKIYRSTHDSGPATADVCSPETTSATFGPVIYPPR